MTSTITFLGHAGLDLRLGSTRLVCDPWLSPRGAYLGSWHPFPPNGHVAVGALVDAPTVFVSSPRPDRFDAETLAAFPKMTRIVVPAFPTTALADGVRALGFADVVELAEGQVLELGDGARLQVWTSATKHEPSATLVLERAGQTVVVQNDCLLDAATLARLAAAQPLFHFLRFSASPDVASAYDVSSAERQGQADTAAEHAARRFFADAQAVNARYLVPAGGPPCFLDERGFELNFGGSVLRDADALSARSRLEAPALVECLRLLSPGDVAVEDEAGWRFETRRPYDDKRRALEDYRQSRQADRQSWLAELRATAEPLDVKEMRSYLRDLFQYEDMTWDMGVLVEFRVTDGPSVWIDFRRKPYRYLNESDEPASHVVATDSAWMSLLLRRKVTWTELLFSREATLHRTSDQDCSALLNHLAYGHDAALFELVRQLNPAVITLQDGQMEYVCQRFCPHRGRDLEYATIERGVLTCTAHGWRFDLRKGGHCLWGGETPLRVKEVRPLKE